MDEQLHGIVLALDPCRSDLATLAREDVGAPAFGEPWHAQVFGLAMALAQAGVFDWAQWVNTFSSEIRANPQMATESSEDAYYRQWSEALITLLKRTDSLTEEEVSDAAEHWRRSYLATEHGRPIEFRRDLPDHPEADEHHHHDHAHAPAPTPIAISRAG